MGLKWKNEHRFNELSLYGCIPFSVFDDDPLLDEYWILFVLAEMIN